MSKERPSGVPYSQALSTCVLSSSDLIIHNQTSADYSAFMPALHDIADRYDNEDIFYMTT